MRSSGLFRSIAAADRMDKIRAHEAGLTKARAASPDVSLRREPYR